MFPVRSWRSRTTSRCIARWRAFSTWPYMIVAVIGRPAAAAASIAATHSPVSIFPGQMTSRTSSTRISAAVPGTESSPAAFSRS